MRTPPVTDSRESEAELDLPWTGASERTGTSTVPSQRIRLAILTDKSFPFYNGGYEKRLFEFARGLGNEFELRVYTSLDRKASLVDGVFFQKISPTTFQDWGSGSRSLLHSALFGLSTLTSPFRDWTPDVLLVESIPYLHLPAVFRWARLHGIRTLLDVNEVWSQYLDSPGFGGHLQQKAILALLGRASATADMVLAISEVTARNLHERFGLNARKLRVIPMGVHTHLSSPPNVVRVGKRDIDIVTVGRMVPIKRQADLVRALSLMKERHLWSGKAVLIGRGQMLPHLERMVSDLGLSGQVFFPDARSDAARDAFLDRSKIFVLCSAREGFSLSTLEAMSKGMAVVVARPATSDVFGVSDLVHDGNNGLYYSVGNVMELSELLSELLNDSSELLRLANAAVDTASQYSQARANLALRSVISDLLSARGEH